MCEAMKKIQSADKQAFICFTQFPFHWNDWFIVAMLAKWHMKNLNFHLKQKIFAK